MKKNGVFIGVTEIVVGKQKIFVKIVVHNKHYVRTANTVFNMIVNVNKTKLIAIIKYIVAWFVTFGAND